MGNAKTLRISLIISILICLSAYLCLAEELDLASDYLCEYGIKLYKEGNIYDAIHELKKSLMVNPRNCTARNYLRKIILVNKLEATSPIEVSFALPYSNCPNREVMFDVRLSQDYPLDYIAYKWDFGDGTSAEGGPNISHIYKKGADYLVKVFVGDHCGYDSETLNIHINTPPVADAGPNLVCCAGRDSIFDGSSSYDADRDALRYMWSFGDGTTAQGAKAIHRYSQPGNYTVTLVVTDNSGTTCNASIDSFIATVTDKPTAVIKVR